jgi:hypothetical protein
MDSVVPLLLASKILATTPSSLFSEFEIPSEWRPDLKGICHGFLGRDVINYRDDEPGVRDFYDFLQRAFFQEYPLKRLVELGYDKASDSIFTGHNPMVAIEYLLKLLNGRQPDLFRLKYLDHPESVTCTYTTKLGTSGKCSFHGDVTSAQHWTSVTMQFDHEFGWSLVSDPIPTLEVNVLDITTFNDTVKAVLRTCTRPTQDPIPTIRKSSTFDIHVFDYVVFIYAIFTQGLCVMFV